MKRIHQPHGERCRFPGWKAIAVVVVLGLISGAGPWASSYFPAFYHLFNPVLGGWSTYDIKDASGEESTLTFAVVAKKARVCRLELRTPENGGTAIASYLLSGDPADDDNVLLIHAKAPGSPALELSRQSLDRLKTLGRKTFGGSAASIGPATGKVRDLPDETLKVSGKRLLCRHLKVVGLEGRTAEVWINDSVVPFGVVKLVSGAESMTLKKFGRGAKPMLKGPYIKVEVP